MTDSGGNNNENAPKKPPPVDYKFPPKRTPREWRQQTAMKVRQYEAIAYTYMGKKPFDGGSGS